MRRLSAVLVGFALVFGAAACSEDAEDQAREVADDTEDAAGRAADEAEDAARQAADRAEDIANDETVNIDNFAYDPKTLKISRGKEVTWVNQDDAEHTVTDDGGAFESKRLGEGDEFSNRFLEAGTFTYFCEVHGKDRMSATVKVKVSD